MVGEGHRCDLVLGALGSQLSDKICFVQAFKQNMCQVNGYNLVLFSLWFARGEQQQDSDHNEGQSSPEHPGGLELKYAMNI